MVSNIDYSKYENMDKKHLMNALISTENKISKYKQEIENHLNLKKFLESKIKKSLTGNKAQKKANLDELSFVAYENSSSHKKALAFEKTLTESEKQQIKQEVEADIKRDYK